MARTPHQHHGFTLIEILVVLVITAIIIAVATLSFGHFGRGRREKIIVDQFSRVMMVAQEQAIMTPSVLGLRIDQNGYVFYEYDALHKTWRRLDTTGLSNPRAFINTFKVKIQKIAHYSRIAKNNASTPAIVFLPSGFVTPFQFELIGLKKFEITVGNNGVAKVVISKVTD